jgi:hypothetical protein
VNGTPLAPPDLRFQSFRSPPKPRVDSHFDENRWFRATSKRGKHLGIGANVAQWQ